MAERDARIEQRKIHEVQEAMQALLSDVLRAGFYGKACVVLAVENGVIQAVWRTTKQIQK